MDLGAGAIGLLAVLVLVQRPLAVALSTAGTVLDTRERLFAAGLMPRGIVVAATASAFQLELAEAGVADADPAGAHLLPGDRRDRAALRPGRSAPGARAGLRREEDQDALSPPSPAPSGTRVNTSAPSAVDRHQVLDPHAELARAGRRRAPPSPRCRPRSSPSALLGQPRPLVHLQPHAVAEAVAEALAVAGASISVARHGVDRRGTPAPARTRRERLLLRVAHQLVDLRGRRRPAGRWRTCACSPSSSRRARAPQSTTTSVPARDLDVARLGVRQRAVGARGDDRRERRLLGPALRASRCSSVQRDLALGAPGQAALEHVARSAASASAAAAAIALQLAGVLHLAQPLDQPARRPPARRPRPPSRRACRGRARSRGRPRSRPGRSGARRGRRAGRARPGSRSKPRHLLLGLLDVAEVGEEQALVAASRRTAPLVPVKPVS